MPSVGAVPTAVPDGMYNVLMSNSNTSKNPAPPPLQSAPGLGNNSSASSNLANGPGSSSATASGAGNGGEEISTIFVVGFPDDMQEREFQNMFIFSPGFEAATLKIPSKDQDDENTAQTSNNNSSRKQIIGFAKFRTRMEALEAKDILSGRKVDAEKGSVLKAEMAKKNLHTKRGLSNDQTHHHHQQQQSHHNHTLQQANQQPMMPSTKFSIFPHQQQQPHQHPRRFSSAAAPGINTSPYDAFYSVPPALPPDLLSPSELSFTDYLPDVFPPATTPGASAFHDTVFPSRAASFDARSGSISDFFGGKLMPSASTSRIMNSGTFNRFSSKSILEEPTSPTAAADRNNLSLTQTIFGQQSITNNGMGPFSPVGGNNHTPFPTTPFSPQGSSSYMANVFEEPYSLQLPPPLPSQVDAKDNKQVADQEEISLTARLNGLSISTSVAAASSAAMANGGLASAGATSPTGFFNFGTFGAINPGDPPCNNTLYVENLPMNTREEELGALFSKYAGYKGLSLRNQLNKLTSLVEFEDMACASQAMKELQGAKLSNSTNGGIRLSFSKTPLGVESDQTKQPSV